MRFTVLLISGLFAAALTVPVTGQIGYQAVCPDGGCPNAPVAAPAAPAFAVTVYFGNSGGSGTVIDFGGGKSLIATAKHFGFAEGDTVSVKAGGALRQGRVAAIDAEADLALVEVDAELPAAYVADSEPARGTAVVQWGSPWYAQGHFVVKQGYWQGTSDLWATTILSESGDSGAGVFDANGKLIAVCVGRSAQGQCVTRLPRIKALMAKVKARAAAKPKIVALVPTKPAAPPPVKAPEPPAVKPAQPMPPGGGPTVVQVPQVQYQMIAAAPARAPLRRLALAIVRLLPHRR